MEEKEKKKKKKKKKKTYNDGLPSIIYTLDENSLYYKLKPQLCNYSCYVMLLNSKSGGWIIENNKCCLQNYNKKQTVNIFYNNRTLLLKYFNIKIKKQHRLIVFEFLKEVCYNFNFGIIKQKECRCKTQKNLEKKKNCRCSSIYVLKIKELHVKKNYHKIFFILMNNLIIYNKYEDENFWEKTNIKSKGDYINNNFHKLDSSEINHRQNQNHDSFDFDNKELRFEVDNLHVLGEKDIEKVKRYICEFCNSINNYIDVNIQCNTSKYIKGIEYADINKRGCSSLYSNNNNSNNSNNNNNNSENNNNSNNNVYQNQCLHVIKSDKLYVRNIVYLLKIPMEFTMSLSDIKENIDNKERSFWENIETDNKIGNFPSLYIKAKYPVANYLTWYEVCQIFKFDRKQLPPLDFLKIVKNRKKLYNSLKNEKDCKLKIKNKKITLAIYSTGNIIITGFTSKYSMKIFYPYIIKILEIGFYENKENFSKMFYDKEFAGQIYKLDSEINNHIHEKLIQEWSKEVPCLENELLKRFVKKKKKKKKKKKEEKRSKKNTTRKSELYTEKKNFKRLLTLTKVPSRISNLIKSTDGNSIGNFQSIAMKNLTFFDLHYEHQIINLM